MPPHQGHAISHHEPAPELDPRHPSSTIHPFRITLIQDHLRNGGTEQQTLAIAEGLARRGLEVHLIVFRSGGALALQATALPITLQSLNQGPLKADWYAPSLKKVLAQLAPDAVLPMGRMANCHAGLLTYTKNRPYKLFATFRTGRPIPYLYRRALRHADHIVANSHEALARLAADYRIHRPDASTVIHNGCIRDFETHIPTFHSSKPNALHLVSISMFRPQKQQIRLIRICSQLPAHIDWRLTLAGEGPTRATCQAEANRLGLADRIHFPSLLKDPRSLYFDADIALHASDQESLPNFLVEAQMSGLPVIAYHANGVSETFQHNQSGILIPHRDEPAFLAALEKLATAPDLRLQMSQAARDYAQQNFSLNSQTAAYIRLLSSLA